MQRLSGERALNAAVLVNGSSNGVRYPSTTTWERDLPLFLGTNQIVVQAASGTVKSTFTGGTIERLLIGDVNRSRVVDDFDLSLFTRAWKKYNAIADFNEDGKINDYDLSLLAAYWGRSF